MCVLFKEITYNCSPLHPVSESGREGGYGEPDREQTKKDEQTDGRMQISVYNIGCTLPY